MKKIELTGVDLELFHEKLPNGLDVYVVPQNNLNNTFASFVSKFGSKDLEFTPLGEKKMIKVPAGIAHFLEHEMFNKAENVIEPMEFFALHGANCNADTNYFKTRYYFSGSSDIKENLNYLLDYVQEPYFTEDNVIKEQGIITQEIAMDKDEPASVLTEKTLENLFSIHPLKYPVLGNVKTINEIDRDILYKCYNTFYHPSNMFIVVTGNVSPKDIIEIIKSNQQTKSYKEFKKIKLPKYEEPITVVKKKEIIKGNVEIPIMTISYKFNVTKLKNYDFRLVLTYIAFYFELQIGYLSEFYETMLKEKLITNPVFITSAWDNEILAIILNIETKQPEEFLTRYQEKMKESVDDEEGFEILKRNLISQYKFMSDDEAAINNKIVVEINKYGKVYEDEVNLINNLTFEEMEKIIKTLDFKNQTIVIMKK